MNLFIFRDILKNDLLVQKYIKKIYWTEYLIRYSNVWFIIIPNDTNYIIKYYMSDSYISYKTWKIKEFLLFEKEKTNYEFFNNNNILIPKYISYWEVNIWDYIFKYAKIENIRINNKKITNFNELDINNFASFINKIHSLKTWYIHWSIHVSDFYITKSWEIWIFDLVNYYRWFIEQDLARICFWYNLDITNINNFLSLYWFEKINYPRLLSEIHILTKFHDYNRVDFYKIVYLFKKLHKLYN
jgi:hypothetical protein